MSAEELSPSVTRASRDVLYREVGGEAVLLDLDKGMYYSLNEVGCQIWRDVTGGKDEETIVAGLLSEYEVAEEEARADVKRLLEELRAAGLIVDGGESQERL